MAIFRPNKPIPKGRPAQLSQGAVELRNIELACHMLNLPDRDGLNRQARNPVRLPDGSPAPASAGSASGDDIIDPRRQVGMPRGMKNLMGLAIFAILSWYGAKLIWMYIILYWLSRS